MITTQVLLGMFGGQEFLVVLLIVLLLFGASRIPQLMRSFGKGMNEFKKAKDGLYDELDDNDKKSTKTPSENESKK